MRALEIIVGLILAVALFIGLKVMGLLLKFAIIAALIGFVVGVVVARMFASRSG
jgi:hypothetical protein